MLLGLLNWAHPDKSKDKNAIKPTKIFFRLIIVCIHKNRVI
ncbi:hypothetical protein FORC88_2995 [Salmonella enterica subsp. enterica serovar Typhimurium]|nr:hypothetical protein FORC88_2995 [Salmonella enterica subsp. enterica serovar Typhimurium]